MMSTGRHAGQQAVEQSVILFPCPPTYLPKQQPHFFLREGPALLCPQFDELRQVPTLRPLQHDDEVVPLQR